MVFIMLSIDDHGFGLSVIVVQIDSISKYPYISHIYIQFPTLLQNCKVVILVKIVDSFG